MTFGYFAKVIVMSSNFENIIKLTTFFLQNYKHRKIYQ